MIRGFFGRNGIGKSAQFRKAHAMDDEEIYAFDADPQLYRTSRVAIDVEITGPCASGKTTFGKALARFLEDNAPPGSSYRVRTAQDKHAFRKERAGVRAFIDVVCDTTTGRGEMAVTWFNRMFRGEVK